jgi:hypothetical protein
MNFNIPDMTPVSMETITILNPNSRELICQLEDVQDFTLSQDETTSDITGRNGRKLNTLKRNKSVTVSGNSGLVSAGLIGLQTGSSFEKVESTTIFMVDTVTVSGNKANTSYVASGSTGAEIERVALKNSNGSLDNTTVFEQSDTVAAGKFTYNPETKELAFNEGEIADDTEIAVLYNAVVKNAYVHTNTSDVYSTKGEVYIDYIMEDTCARQYHVQVHLPLADFSGSFSLDVSSNQTVQAFEMSALAGSCGNAGKFWDWTIVDFSEDDVA